MDVYTNYSEKELIELLRQDDTRALSELYYLHVKQLKYFILKIAKSPFLAEDVVHDTFIKIWENRLSIDAEQAFKPYLYTIARRHLLNLLKRAKHEITIVEEIRKYTITEDNATELLLDFNESNSLFTEAVKNLPTQCREVFIRCHLQGLTYKQAASDLGISESTINNQMVKGLKSVREFIALRNVVSILIACLIK